MLRLEGEGEVGMCRVSKGFDSGSLADKSVCVRWLAWVYMEMLNGGCVAAAYILVVRKIRGIYEKLSLEVIKGLYRVTFAGKRLSRQEIGYLERDI